MNRNVQDASVEHLNAAKDSLAAGFKSLISDAENLLKATANYSAEGLSVARTKLEDSVEEARVQLANAQGVVKEKTAEAMDYTMNYARAHPWKVLGAAVAVAALIVLFTTRK